MIRCEPHAHTAEISPCAHMKAREVVQRVRDAGYDLLVVTDHFVPNVFEGLGAKGYRKGVKGFFEGYRLAREAGDAVGLNVLPALEFGFSYGREDFLVYGVTDDDLMDIGWPFEMTLKAFKAAVNACGGLVFQAHPFRSYLTVADPHDLDGIEVFNMNPRHESHNEKAEAFADKHGLLKVCGSDVHQSDDEGGAALLLPKMPVDIKAFAGMLRGGGCVIEKMR